MRQELIVAKALAYSIALIDHLPGDLQPLSDQHDMKELLADMLGDTHIAHFQEIAQRALSALLEPAAA